LKEGTTGEFFYETMPLRESKIKPQSWKDIEEQFAIFYSSQGDDGIMWCPVCSWCGGSGLFSFVFLTV